MYEIADLVKKRLELKMPLREVQKHTGLNISDLSLIERGKKILSQRQILTLKQFYDDCEAGRINYQQTKSHVGSTYNSVKKQKRQKKREVSSQKISEMIKIRKKLQLTQYDVADAVGIKQQIVSKKELEISPLLKNEYKKMMNFFKQEKLRQIFGEKKK
ncbi:MAG: hypothetical protein IJQ99_09580 [Synergistaceae bacterium]|nr:hypothetical protein [Synergistaceae bacterium]MBR0317104.1 hypothetical protein [Synergistaceae bacterium]